MSNPFNRGPREIKDEFNPFLGRPSTNGLVPAASFEKAPQKTTLNPTATATTVWTARASRRASEENQLRTLLDRLGRPHAIIIGQIIREASETGAYSDVMSWLTTRGNRRDIPHWLATVGYTPVYNDARGTGLWLIARVRQVAYARRDLAPEERVEAVRALQARFRIRPAAIPSLPPVLVAGS